MPSNTVYIGRGSKWGNPFPVGKPGLLDRQAIDNTGAVGMFKDMLSDPEMMELSGYPDDFSELKGKDLACWCKEGEPCHGDILLELANKGLKPAKRDESK